METTATIIIHEDNTAVPLPLVNTETTATDTVKLTPYEIARNNRMRRDYVFRV